jgi:hypothetical protein
VREVINSVMKDRQERGIRSPKDLITQVMLTDPISGAAVLSESSSFRPALLVNRIERSEDRRLGEDMCSACREYFGSQIECLGALANDRLLARSVQQRRPAAELYPESPFIRSLMPVVERLRHLTEDRGAA